LEDHNMGGSRGGRGRGAAQAAQQRAAQQAAALRAQQAAAAAQAAAIARAQQEAAQRALAAKQAAEARSALDAQNTGAYNAMQESFTTATEGVLPRLAQESMSEDVARQETQSANYASAGGSATGGGVNLGSIRQQALSNLGVSAPLQIGGAISGPASTNNNPAANTPTGAASGNMGAMIAANKMGGGGNAPTNAFRLPKAINLAFGGS
jgi:hypothetical protein